jgi:cell division protein FtsX
MLLSVNLLLVVNMLTGEAVKTVKEQIDVSIYFAHDAEDENITEVKQFVNSFPEVIEH